MDGDSLNISSETGPKRVFLWATHRSMSSVLTKCLSFMDDMHVWYEPYLSCYENLVSDKEGSVQTNNSSNTPAKRPTCSHLCDRYYHPSRKTFVIPTTKTTYEPEIYTYQWVKSQLEQPDPSKKYVFVKELVSSLGFSPIEEFLPDAVPYKHTFMIRHPIKVFTSFKRALRKEFNVSTSINILTDFPYYRPKLFYEQLYKRWDNVRQSEGCNPIILDADQLMLDPESTLSKYFEVVGFPWNSDLLRWEPGYEKLGEWNICTNYLRTSLVSSWCHQSYMSTHFEKTSKHSEIPLDELSQDIRECVEVSMPYYDTIMNS